ncbi:MAG: aminotransferase class V-fold PLP-dependent enzyme [Spirochaetes bacterium]|nr:aminotransferase class V-fold PLP-dependent enzyme [Spirochaetota bacterium]
MKINFDYIYLDNASTTKPYDYLKDLVNNYFENYWMNPSSIYSQFILEKIEETRVNILKYILNINGTSDNIENSNIKVIFTPSATYSNNAIIFGLRNYLKNKNIIIYNFEHASLKNPIKQINNIYPYLNVRTKILTIKDYFKTINKDHNLSENILTDNLLNHIDNETGLVIFSFINNETGFKFNIDRISKEIKKINKNTLILCDMTQGFLKYKIDNIENIDFITASSHKFHSLRGCGIIILKNNELIKPIIYGGSQEAKIYPSTENTLSILSINEVIKNQLIIKNKIEEDFIYVRNLARYFLENLIYFSKKLDLDIFFFSKEFIENNPDNSSTGIIDKKNMSFSPYIIKFFIKNIKSEILVNELAKFNIFVSTSSACSSKKEKQIDYKIDLGFPEYFSEGGLRVSFSKFNNIKEIDIFFFYLEKLIKELFLIFP